MSKITKVPPCKSGQARHHPLKSVEDRAKRPLPPQWKHQLEVDEAGSYTTKPLPPKFKHEMVNHQDGTYTVIQPSHQKESNYPATKEVQSSVRQSVDGIDEATSKVMNDDIFVFQGTIQDTRDPIPRFVERTDKAGIPENRRDYANGVYHINAGPGTHSGTLKAEDDPAVQATIPWEAVHRLKQIRAGKTGLAGCSCNGHV